MPTLEWIGKNKVLNHDKEVPFRLLDAKYTFDKDGQHEPSADDGNMIIHGDNLQALKALLPKYGGRVDCIYIDPPYNTGNEGWVYNDNVNDPQIKKWLGEVVGNEEKDLCRHDKWLCMMYPRLKLLHELLSNTGVLWISIDEHEIDNLIIICKEIFGNNNVDYIVWQKQDARVDRNTNAKIINRFKSIHEFIVVCYRNKKNTEFNKMYRLPEWKKTQKNPDNDYRGNWQSGIVSYEEGHKNEDKASKYYYTVISPSGVKWTRHWFYTEEDMRKLILDNRVYFGKSPQYENVPRLKTFENEEKEYYMESILRGVGTSSSAKDEIEEIFSDRDLFDTPKPKKLIMELIRVSSKNTSIVLDSFAGSGTTAHAVMDLNKEKSGDRKFILVEMMDYAENITAERVKRVIKGYGEDDKLVEGTGGGFIFYELGVPLFEEDGNLNPAADEDKIREYIWYTETKTAFDKNVIKPFLGKFKGMAYYFYYESDRPTKLDKNFVRRMTEEAASYLIYADICLLTDEFMEKHNIKFKKIPRDITKI